MPISKQNSNHSSPSSPYRPPSLIVPLAFLSFSFSLILTGSAVATVTGVTVVGEAGFIIGSAGALNTKSSFSFEGAGLRDEGAGLGEAPPPSDPESAPPPPPPLSELLSTSSSSSLSAPECIKVKVHPSQAILQPKR